MNVQFIIHDADGKILRTGSCPKSMLSLQAQEGEIALIGKADDSKHRIVGGKIKDKTSEQKEKDKPKEIPIKKQKAMMTNEQYENILKRLDKLEGV